MNLIHRINKLETKIETLKSNHPLPHIDATITMEQKSKNLDNLINEVTKKIEQIEQSKSNTPINVEKFKLVLKITEIFQMGAERKGDQTMINKHKEFAEKIRAALNKVE